VSSFPAFERFQALGCQAVVGVADGAVMSSARAEVMAEVAACDLACSRFRDDSELMGLNAPGRRQLEVAVSPWLADALGMALRAARDTDGLVDPTIGQCLIDLGYDRSFELLTPDQPLVVRATHTPAWEHVSVRRQAARVPLGVRLDLGATAKALCADRAAQRASIVSGCGVLVSLGGDIALAGQAPDDGWAVRVTDRADIDPASGPGQTIAVRQGGLATSGVAARRWAQEGWARHHLVDPRTAMPAVGTWRTVSVAAASCVEANISSTAAVIMGGPAPQWLSRRGTHARLVGVDGEVVFVGDWPPATDEHRGAAARAHQLAAATHGVVP
jgi:FAD:protein FMN transferase